MLRDADAAMYRAKAHGRDRSAMFDEEMRAEATLLLDLEADLRRAILNYAFEPPFQPILRLADGAIVRHEALLLWNHEPHRPLPPGEFLCAVAARRLDDTGDRICLSRVFVWCSRHVAGKPSASAE